MLDYKPCYTLNSGSSSNALRRASANMEPTATEPSSSAMLACTCKDEERRLCESLMMLPSPSQPKKVLQLRKEPWAPANTVLSTGCAQPEPLTGVNTHTPSDRVANTTSLPVAVPTPAASSSGPRLPPISLQLFSTPPKTHRISKERLASYSPHASAVLPWLYLGNKMDAQNEDFLRDHGVSCILNVSRRLDLFHLQGRPGMVFHFIRASDAPYENLIGKFAEGIAVIEAARLQGRTVLVHCTHGVSRSATLLAAYLIHTYAITPAEALDILCRVRPIVCPNPGFLAQLGLFYEGIGR